MTADRWQAFERYAARPELGAGLAVALRLGWACRACDTLAATGSYGPKHQPEQLERAATYLRLFLDPGA